jgi:hypothetical protein
MTMNASRLTSWLQRVPASATRLELYYDSIAGQHTLASFTRTEVESTHASAQADGLLELAQDHCESVQARCSFRVVWCEESGRVIATKPLRCEPELDDLETHLAGSGRAPKEDPSHVGIIAQMMRHIENRERLLNLAMGTNIKTLHDQLRDARAEADQLRGQLRIERQRTVEAQEGNEPDPESEARQEAMHKVAEAVVTHLVPLAAARLREGLQ